MKVLVIDVGGHHVKVLVSGKRIARRFESGISLSPSAMVKGVKAITADWAYDAVSIGYPGPVVRGLIAAEPRNLARGWVGFDFQKAFGRPVRIVNDAAMQALGSYKGGRMLFLGLGTGLGSAMIADGDIVPMELAHLPYRKGRSYEEYVGVAGLERLGLAKWRKHVATVIDLLRAALVPDYVVIGGGNAKKIARLSPGVRRGMNANAFAGGFRLWEDARENRRRRARPVSPRRRTRRAAPR